MSTKRLEYNPLPRLGEAVIGVLERCGPCSPADIARQMCRDEGGRPKPSAISKVLADYLTDRVTRCGKNKWKLIDTKIGA